MHALALDAECRACVRSCPTGALVLDDDGLHLDLEACDGCGLCRAACPRVAITFAEPVSEAFTLRDDGTALAHCNRVAPSRLACRHAISARDLDCLAAEHVRRLVVLTQDCATCSRDMTASGLGSAVARHKAVRESRSEQPVIVACTSYPPPAQTWASGDATRSVDRSRRRLFSAFFRPRMPHAPPDSSASEAPPPEALIYHAPALDPARCEACDACARICPDGAILRENGKVTGYRIRPEQCSGCGLCVDICESNAIEILDLAPAAESLLPLTSRRCRACGAPFSETPLRQDQSGLCRICRKKNHSRALFQIIEAP